jgi:hypothetical protein
MIARSLGAGVVVAALAAGVVVAVHHRGDGSPHALPTASPAAGGLGPEGMPLAPGDPLSTVAGAATGATVDGIRCDTDEQVAYHIHTHLAIYVDGAPRTVPAGIGIVEPQLESSPHGMFAQASRCYYWLHVHAADGVIHIESPTEETYTLGQFFDIWNQPLAIGRVGPASGAMTIFVDGKPYTGDPRAIPLLKHGAIQIDIGQVVPPAAVDWSTSQL